MCTNVEYLWGDNTSKQSASETETEIEQRAYKTKADFSELLTGEIPEVALSRSYHAGLVLVLLLSLLAPFIYISLLFALVYGLFSFIDYLPSLWGGSDGITLKLLFTSLALFIPTILLLFLFKPLLATYTQPERYELARQQAPALFNLVEVMCSKMDVPAPAHIVLDNRVNASVGAKDGLRSVVRGELTLTLGLPLVAGLELRQLVGVLAHEFGHFSQRSAMFAHTWVHRVNSWFANRAYQEDEWDQRLAAWSNKVNGHQIGSLATAGAQGGIFCSRLLLSLLYRLNLLVTQYMARAMEYHADSYESIFIGSEQVESTSLRLRRLAYAEQQVRALNINSWNDKLLLEDIALAIATVADAQGDQLFEKIKQDMLELKIDAYASHPADRDRLSKVKLRQDVGIVHQTFPAQLLWNDFTRLSRKVSLFTYWLDGFESAKHYVVDNRQLLHSEEKKQGASHALDEFLAVPYPQRFLALDVPELDSDRCLDLRGTRFAIENSLQAYQEDNALLQHFLGQRSAVQLAQVYIKNEIPIKPREYALRGAETKDIEIKLQSLFAQLKEKRQSLSGVDRLIYQRLTQVIAQMDEMEKGEYEAKLQSLRAMARLEPALNELETTHQVLSALLVNDSELQGILSTDINIVLQRCVRGANGVAQQCRNFSCQREGYTKLDEFVSSWVGGLPIIANPLKPQQTAEACRQVFAAVRYHYYWLLADTSECALAQEKQCGLNPLLAV